MSYENCQAYFLTMHAHREARILEATRPQREAVDERKRKNCEWKLKSEELKAIFCKPAKLLLKDNKSVARVLHNQFLVSEQLVKQRRKLLQINAPMARLRMRLKNVSLHQEGA